jgi:hypothetical protein
MKKVSVAVLFTLFLAVPGFAQLDDFHMFPQFADGNYGPNTYYFKSTLYILGRSATAPATTCDLNLRGMTANFESGASGSNFNITVPVGGYIIARTTGTQPIQSGYATLSCSAKVYASLVFTYFYPNGTKVSEATVFSSSENSGDTRMVFDHTNGARLGIAIANDTDLTQTYNIVLTGSFGTVNAIHPVAPRRSLVGFIDDLVPGLPPDAVGVMTIVASADHYVIGLRFTGGIFTTVPGN